MIKSLDLKLANRKFESELCADAIRVIESGRYVLGPELLSFEKLYGEYCGTDYCVGVGNGLDALKLSLQAWRELGLLHDGDEVIVAANTYIATILAISESGLTPILVEPNERTFNLTPESVERALTKRTRIILPVHLYGQLCDMPKLRQIADQKGLLVLEDAAQAHGAHIEGVKAGAWGHAGAFSFYPSKILGAIGDAGAVTTSDQEFAECLRSVRNYGSSTKYENQYIGSNSRLDEIQAAFLKTKLRYLDQEIEHRNFLAQIYSEEIVRKRVILPSVPPLGQHVWHQFVIRVPNREFFQKEMLERGIETAVHYPIAPHKQRAYRKWNAQSFPLTEKLSREVVSLPMDTCLTERDIKLISREVNGLSI